MVPSKTTPAGLPVSGSRLPTTERANRWISRRIGLALVRAKCFRHAMTAVAAEMLPRVDRERVFHKQVVRAPHGSSAAMGTGADRLPVASHGLILFLRELLPVR